MINNLAFKIYIKTENCMKLICYLLKVQSHICLQRKRRSRLSNLEVHGGYPNSNHSHYQMLKNLSCKRQKNEYGLVSLNSIWVFRKFKGSYNCQITAHIRVYEIVFKSTQSFNIYLDTISVDLGVGYGKFWFVILSKLYVQR